VPVMASISRLESLFVNMARLLGFSFRMRLLFSGLVGRLEPVWMPFRSTDSAV